MGILEAAISSIVAPNPHIRFCLWQLLCRGALLSKISHQKKFFLFKNTPINRNVKMGYKFFEFLHCCMYSRTQLLSQFYAFI
jgi:hypothetical protein